MSEATPHRAGPRGRRRWPKAFAALLLFFVALEVVLQIGALLMAGTTAQANTSNNGDSPAVLCIGDSFTFGIGTTSPHRSYPSRLETELRERGLDVRVTNAGKPGQNSREALLRLRRQLTDRTKVICALLGTNDSWSRPAALTAAELAEPMDVADAGTFEWKWRTGRLLAVLFRFSFGSWNAEPESTAASSAGQDLGAADTTAATAAGFALLIEHGLEFGWIRGQLPAAVTRPRDPATQDSAREFWALLTAERDEEAVALAERVLAQRGESAEWLARVVRAQARLGRPTAAALAKLAALANGSQADAAIDWYIWALGQARREAEALAAARARVQTEPNSLTAWLVITRVTFDADDRPAFRRAVARTLPLLGTTAAERSAWFVRDLVSVTPDFTAPQVARLLVAAYLLHPDELNTHMTVARAVRRGKVSRSDFEAALLDARIPTALRDRLNGILARLDSLGAPTANWQRVLQDHLVAIEALAREAGAELVLIGYPRHLQDVEAAQRAAAEQLGVRHISVYPAFDEALRTRQRHELFIPDGHCNDAGYAIVARVVAGAVAEALSR
ncbi:MAG: GDSL-type esterase/lipase family protein [bacterium]|nr:GDSL-type esterase/lipase family protein [bacterium]